MAVDLARWPGPRSARCLQKSDRAPGLLAGRFERYGVRPQKFVSSPLELRRLASPVPFHPSAYSFVPMPTTFLRLVLWSYLVPELVEGFAADEGGFGGALDNRAS